MSYPKLSLLILLGLGALPLSASAQGLAYPDGYVLWQSNRQDSRNEVYRARADGSQVTRLTFSGASLPAWAPDGRWISYMDPSSTVYVMRPDGTGLRPLTAGWEIAWLHDNSGLLVGEGSDYNVYDPETGESTHLFSRSEFPQFDGTTFQPNSVTHDNRYVLLGSHLYINGYSGSNGSFVSEYSAVILDLLHKDKVYFLGSGCWPFTPPLGDLVFHICADCPTRPDIYHMRLGDLDTRASYAAEVAHEDSDWGHEYNPRVSNDNQWLAYMASAGCHQGEGCDYDIWLHPLGTDPSQRLRVTQDTAFDGYPQLYVGPLWQPSTAPRLLVTPNRVTFFANATSLPAPQVLKLKNTGGGTLGVATVTTDGSASWLDVVPGPADITVGLRPGAALTRGIQCVNLTVAVAGAVGSPLTVPITLIADDSFPLPAVDAGVGLDAGMASEAGAGSEAGVALDAGAADMPLTIDVATVDAAVTITVDASSLDCDAVNGAGADGGTKWFDGGSVGPGSSGGCGCSLGAPTVAAGPASFALLGLAWLARRRRSAKP